MAPFKIPFQKERNKHLVPFSGNRLEGWGNFLESYEYFKFLPLKKIFP
jgi:hypothetical protein